MSDRGGRRPLRGGQRREPVRERDEVVDHRQADVEDVLQAVAECGGRAAGALDKRVPVAVDDLRGRHGQERRERAENQLVVVGGDQLLVVGDDLGRARRVRDDVELDRVAHQAAGGVDVVGPELVALLERLAVGREVPGQRQRRADRDRRLVTRARARADRARRRARACAARARRAAGASTSGEQCGNGGHGRNDQSPSPRPCHLDLLLPAVITSICGHRTRAQHGCNRLRAVPPTGLQTFAAIVCDVIVVTVRCQGKTCCDLLCHAAARPSIRGSRARARAAAGAPARRRAEAARASGARRSSRARSAGPGPW